MFLILFAQLSGVQPSGEGVCSTGNVDCAGQLASILSQVEVGEIEPWDRDYTWFFESTLLVGGRMEYVPQIELTFRNPAGDDLTLDKSKQPFRVFPVESDRCRNTEAPVRVRIFTEFHTYERNGVPIASAFDGMAYEDTETVYCLDKRPFFAFFKPTAYAGTRNWGPWHLDDTIYPAKDPRGYAPVRFRPERGETVQPLSDVVVNIPGDGGQYPPVKTMRLSGGRCPSGECTLMVYHGSMYETCADTERCADQGYAVLLGPDGTVIDFLGSSLVQTESEYQIQRSGLQRIVGVANDKPALESLFASLADRETTVVDYLARVSKSAYIYGGGSTTSTFFLHLAKVREELALGDWPTVGRVAKPYSGNKAGSPNWFRDRGFGQRIRP